MGATSIVMVKPRFSNWWVRSSMGIIWPGAGYGKIKTCALLLPETVDMAST